MGTGYLRQRRKSGTDERYATIDAARANYVPACKRCGEPCQDYGGKAGYSTQCLRCNQGNAARQRARRAKVKREATA